MADTALRMSRRARTPERTRSQVLFIVLNVVIVIGALVMFFPFLWTVITSITPGATLTNAPALIPKDPSLGEEPGGRSRR
jgi:multiple sugar transport system permease protein